MPAVAVAIRCWLIDSLWRVAATHTEAHLSMPQANRPHGHTNDQPADKRPDTVPNIQYPSGAMTGERVSPKL